MPRLFPWVGRKLVSAGAGAAAAPACSLSLLAVKLRRQAQAAAPRDAELPHAPAVACTHAHAARWCMPAPAITPTSLHTGLSARVIVQPPFFFFFVIVPPVCLFSSLHFPRSCSVDRLFDLAAPCCCCSVHPCPRHLSVGIVFSSSLSFPVHPPLPATLHSTCPSPASNPSISMQQRLETPAAIPLPRPSVAVAPLPCPLSG